ncbi:MAG: serine/threonine protein kinase [Pyrinomonadaceae bacterium]|nr:serine/threonine protein kinase [Pyrinomonadaceae bacterium]
MSKTFADRWSVKRDLTPGGQAWTYVVEDLTNPGKEYVLKRLKNLDRIKRFEQEIVAIRLLDHPHIIRPVSVELSEESPFFVSEYCEGGELTTEKVGEWSVNQKLQLFETLTVALAHAHAKGVIHRDIKPSNILFRSDGTAVVADFGICINTDDGLERLTEMQEQVGPRYYMAPELADGRLEDVTPSADVYSLGKLLYWLLAGKLFDREKHTHERWDLRINAENPAILTIYDEIFSKTIIEDPNARFASGTELWQATRNVIETLEKEGRYLDADVPSSCLFCGIGRYAKKEIIPRITPLSHNSQFGGVAEFETNYSNLYGLGSQQPERLSAGNIKGDSYISFLTLECGRCGNLQFFKLENGHTLWKNARPSV